MTIACPNCGETFDMPDDYLRQFGGRTTQCTCGQEFQIPTPVHAVADYWGKADGPAGETSALDEPGRDPAIYGTGIWHDEGLAVVARGARLPKRCFRCNAAADRTVPFLLKWAEPEKIGRGMGRALAEKLREEQLLVTAYVCPRHARLLRFGRWLGPAVMLCGVAVVGLAAAFEVRNVHVDIEGRTILVGIALLIVGNVLRRVRIGQLAASRIDHHQAVVKGFEPAFLSSLPSWAEARMKRTDRTAANLEHLMD